MPEFLPAVQVGANIVAQGMTMNLRRQELQAEQSMQRLRERQSVAQIELLTEQISQIQQANRMIRLKDAEWQNVMDGVQWAADLGMPKEEALANVIPNLLMIDPQRATSMITGMAKVAELQAAPQKAEIEKQQLEQAKVRTQQETRRLDIVERELSLREEASKAKAKGMTREQFILENAPRLLGQSMIPLTAEEVPKILAEVYDSIAEDPFGLFEDLLTPGGGVRSGF